MYGRPETFGISATTSIVFIYQSEPSSKDFLAFVAQTDSRENCQTAATQAVFPGLDLKAYQNSTLKTLICTIGEINALGSVLFPYICVTSVAHCFLSVRIF